jgi:hypothetical protein
MQVLFLGGPWDGQRHEVTPRRAARGAEALPTHFNVTVALAAAVGGERGAPFTYVRRFARRGGERHPVYVAHDYNGPPRA